MSKTRSVSKCSLDNERSGEQQSSGASTLHVFDPYPALPTVRESGARAPHVSLRAPCWQLPLLHNPTCCHSHGFHVNATEQHRHWMISIYLYHQHRFVYRRLRAIYIHTVQVGFSTRAAIILYCTAQLSPPLFVQTYSSTITLTSRSHTCKPKRKMMCWREEACAR